MRDGSRGAPRVCAPPHADGTPPEPSRPPPRPGRRSPRMRRSPLRAPKGPRVCNASACRRAIRTRGPHPCGAARAIAERPQSRRAGPQRRARAIHIRRHPTPEHGRRPARGVDRRVDAAFRGQHQRLSDVDFGKHGRRIPDACPRAPHPVTAGPAQPPRADACAWARSRWELNSNPFGASTDEFVAQILEEVDRVLQPRLDERRTPAQPSLEGRSRFRRSTQPPRRSAA